MMQAAEAKACEIGVDMDIAITDDAGGLPVFVGDDIVGGVGCSSGTPDQDEIVAQAGVDALMASLS